ncbi:MAG: sodium:alanine symporter family protein [Clostridia bacterium]|nr:sodium:alanine symporter family protein [Clostridia bacterium]
MKSESFFGVSGVVVLEFLNERIVGVSTAVMLLAVGVFFSFRLGFFYIRHPVKMLKAMLWREGGDGISPFRAVTLALAGTLGVGNIAGVASSIAIGGYGSVFWMWVSALVAMVLKYAEITLAISHRRIDRESGEPYGGAPYYIKDTLSRWGFKVAGKALAGFFALLCIVNSVTMGCMLQANAVSTSFEGVLQIEPWVVGAVVAILCCFVITGNARWVSGFCETTVPLMTLGYIGVSLAVIWARREALPDAFALILNDAFAFDSVAGGVVGFLISTKLRAGVMRGLVSNEAGCGTAPTAHASSNTKSPARQGVWGIFEVFVDTILLCTLTAIVIILAGDGVLLFAENPMMMAVKAYSLVLGEWSEYYMCISVLFFAFATMVCWAHYGKESLRAITKNRGASAIFIIIFCLFVFLGSVAAPAIAWLLADLSIGIMTIINLPILCINSREIRLETDKLFKG